MKAHAQTRGLCRWPLGWPRDGPNGAGRVMFQCRDDILRLWSDPVVQALLQPTELLINTGLPGRACILVRGHQAQHISLDTHYRHFKIDEYLKRYPKALQSLHLAGDYLFGELESLLTFKP